MFGRDIARTRRALRAGTIYAAAPSQLPPALFVSSCQAAPRGIDSGRVAPLLEMATTLGRTRYDLARKPHLYIQPVDRIFHTCSMFSYTSNNGRVRGPLLAGHKGERQEVCCSKEPPAAAHDWPGATRGFQQSGQGGGGAAKLPRQLPGNGRGLYESRVLRIRTT